MAIGVSGNQAMRLIRCDESDVVPSRQVFAGVEGFAPVDPLESLSGAGFDDDSVFGVAFASVDAAGVDDVSLVPESPDVELPEVRPEPDRLSVL